jgi:uncharacterized membrane protein (UPF0127 family)
VMLINGENGSILAEDVRKATAFWSRFRGLMFTRVLPPEAALHIVPCQSIHTYFMKYSIDVLYLDKHDQVIGIDKELRPGKIGRMLRNTVSVIELPSGRISETDTSIGQGVYFAAIPKS